MKFVLFVLVALFACAFAYQCQSSTCVQTGGSCQYTDTAAPVCGYGTFCSSSEVCTAQLAAGAVCSDSNQCSAGYDCEGNVCVATRVGPGAPCSSNSQCFTNNGDSSTCVSGKCAFTAAGGACNTENDNCGKDANIGYCKSPDSVNTTGVCSSFISASGACDGIVNLCNSYSSCINGTCVNYGAAAQGSLCKSTQDCADGLVCTNGGSSTCQLPNTTPTSTSGQTCSFSSDCGTYEECSCSGVSASTCQFLTANNAGVTAASVAYFKCKAETSYACYLDLSSCESCDVQLCSFISSQNLTGSSLSFASCSVSPRVASLYASKCASNSTSTSSTSTSSTSTTTTSASTTTTSASSSVVVSLSVLLVFVGCTLF